jgi:hypothetical protein
MKVYMFLHILYTMNSTKQVSINLATDDSSLVDIEFAVFDADYLSLELFTFHKGQLAT